MFEGGVPEKVIQERTGHRSLDGLRKYERTSTEQHTAAVHVVGSKEAVKFASTLAKRPPSPPSGIRPQSNQSALGQYSFTNCSVSFFQGTSDMPPPKREALVPAPDFNLLDQLLAEFED